MPVLSFGALVGSFIGGPVFRRRSSPLLILIFTPLVRTGERMITPVGVVAGLALGNVVGSITWVGAGV